MYMLIIQFWWYLWWVVVISGVFSQERSHECHPKLIWTATTSHKVIIPGAYQVFLEHNLAIAYFYQSDLSTKTHHRYPFNLYYGLIILTDHTIGFACFSTIPVCASWVISTSAFTHTLGHIRVTNLSHWLKKTQQQKTEVILKIIIATFAKKKTKKKLYCRVYFNHSFNQTKRAKVG